MTPKRPPAHTLVLALVILLTSCMGVASAAATPPEVVITAPKQGKFVNQAKPTIEGTCQEFDPGNFSPIKLYIYEGETATGTPRVLPFTVTPSPEAIEWSVEVPEALPSGTYTVEAEQSSTEGGVGHSKPVTFTITTGAPPVVITYPPSGSSSAATSQLITGSAGTAQGQFKSVTVEVFSGSTIPIPPAAPVATATVTPSGGNWSEVFALAPGTYTARALQSDEAGNVGVSLPHTFTLTGVPARPTQPPAASFTWLPAAPVAGQTIALVSNSSDAFSPITAFAWDLLGSGPFKPAGPVLTTSFATPGSHNVRLLVTDALGASSVAMATIPVSAAPLKLMQPFPIVRLGGAETSEGVKLSSLTVQAPAGVRVTVTCRGHGCHTRQQGILARATSHNRRGNSVLLSFPNFQRPFRAGVTLEVRVMGEDEIGKYTRFVVRRHAVPTRTDACVAGLDPRAIACPA